MPVVRPLAVELVALIDGLSVSFTAAGTSHTSTVKGYLWDQPHFDRLPCAMVRLPEISRTGVDEQESQLGSRDFILEFPVDFVVDLSKAEYSQEQLLASVEAFINAVDADSPPLADNSVIDCKVTAVGRPEQLEGSRSLLVYPTTVELLKLTV